MRCFRGSAVTEMTRDRLREIASAYAGVVLDIGAGSGKQAYRLARSNPDKFLIGLETSQDSLLDCARKIARKPSKGGLENILYVLGSIDDPPVELHEAAEEAIISFPWTNLLAGLVKVEPSLVERIRGLIRSGGILSVVMGYDRKHEGAFVNEHDLPDLTEGYIREEMAPEYSALGLELVEAAMLDAGELRKSLSDWGKRLAFGKERRFYRMRFRRC